MFAVVDPTQQTDEKDFLEVYVGCAAHGLCLNGLVYMIDRMKDQSVFAHIRLLKRERSQLRSGLASDLL